MDTANAFTDATAIVESLDSITIRERLRKLDDEARALRVLLRAAVARERRQPRQQAEAVHQ